MSSRRFRRTALVVVLIGMGLTLLAMSGGLAASTRTQALGRVYLPVVNPRPIATEPPPGDLFLRGRVYDRLTGPLAGIGGAQVSIISCMGGRRYSATTLPDGLYVLIVPQAYVTPCAELTLEVSAAGYAPQQAVLSVADLRANPQLNVALQRIRTVTPTPTTTPSGDLTIHGTVYRTDLAPGGEIIGAQVSAQACTPAQRRQTASQAQGVYSITLPAAYLIGCGTIRIEAIAPGYNTYVAEVSVTDLRNNPQHHIPMVLSQTLPPLP